MKHHRLHLQRTLPRLALTGALALAAMAALTGVASANWGTAGHDISRVEWPPTACGDGVRAHLAFEPLGDPGLLDAASHPFAPLRISVTASPTAADPPSGPVVAQQIVALPRQTVWAPLGDSDPITDDNTFAYSGEVVLPFETPLPIGTHYVSLWHGLDDLSSLGGYFAATGSSAAIPVARCSVQGSVLARGCFGARATIQGTDGDDVLTGTSGNDVIVAGAGNDTVSGFAGDDLVCGGPGNDVIAGGDGNDGLDGGDGADQLSDHYGNDLLAGGAGADTLENWFGDDILQGGAGDDVLHGRFPFELLVGYAALDGGSGSGDSCYLGNVALNCEN